MFYLKEQGFSGIMKPSITVLITLRNSKDTIKKCIESVLNIDYPNYKVYVVDAFSNDGSYEILKEFGKKIELHQLKGWAPTAYNWAIDRIDTEYIALIDADCTVPRDWLEKLIKGFDEKDVVETAGYCATPKTESRLQRLIGIELGGRFNQFGKYITAAPTMNVMFKTETAKKLKFNEKLRVGYDKDFCFNLLKIGKIRYLPDAIIYHHHRSTWKSFFKQQYTYARYQWPLYMRKKDRIIKGDKISKPTFMLQILVGYLFVISIFLSFFLPLSIYIPFMFLAILVSMYTYDAIMLSEKISDPLYFFFMFVLRNIAWNIGMFVGFFSLFKKS